MTHRSLPAFAKWFLAQPIHEWRPPLQAVYQYVTTGGIVGSVVLHRDGEYQVELFSGLPAGTGEFPQHTHPNVDSIEVFLSGQIEFEIAGRRSPDLKPGARSRIRPSDPHGATVGPHGGAFLSIQRWLNGVQPTSIGLDWEGPPHVEVRT